MVYTNKDLYEYILKIDSEQNILHNTYQKMLEILLNEGLDNELSKETKDALSRIFSYREFNLQEENFNDAIKLINTYIGLNRARVNEDNCYRVYSNLKSTPSINDMLFYFTLKEKKDIPEIVSYLSPIVNSLKEKLKQATIEPYYGTVEYLILRTKAVLDAISMLKEQVYMENNNLIEEAYDRVDFLLAKMIKIDHLDYTEEIFEYLEECEGKTPVNENEYDKIRNCYVQMLSVENSLLAISANIWKNYSLNNNGVFIHQLTCDIVESDCMDTICTSFYSDNTHIITKYQNGNVGYAYPMDITKTFTICSCDVGSWTVSKDEFIERGLPNKWQLDYTGLWYEYPYNTKLYPPEYIENEIKKNGSFAEIIIDNRVEKVKPLYCFYTQNANEEQIEKIKAIAIKNGLELRFLDIEKKEILNNM